MVRPELVLELVDSFLSDNKEMFIDVAKEVIKDERRKRHGRIVCELTDILDKCIYKDWQDAET
ncbi:MAG: hypothetical protein LBT59_08290, partial [Clostridiales bacterium]|nr:hypothetical protein [Clostridiales bacterium]